MTMETLDRAYRAVPFKPFAFRLADGRSLPVPRPSSVAFNPKGRTAVVIDRSDAVEWFDLSLVVSLSFEGEPATAK
jgi:hypothetical protein